jgi:hypothetical protein
MKAQNTWQAIRGQDFLQMVGFGGSVLAGINNVGVPYGALAAAPSNVFNVKSYGALGNTRAVYDAVTTGTNTVTSATAIFTAADVGKICWASQLGYQGPWTRVGQGVIVSVVSPTEITVSTTLFNAGYSALVFVFGSDDTAALIAAWQAACAATETGTDTASGEGTGILYAPGGGYLFQQLLFQNGSASILGDGPYNTVFFPSPNFNFSSSTGFSYGFGMLNFRTGSEIGNFGVNASYLNWAWTGTQAGCLVDASGARYVHDLLLQNIACQGATGAGIGGIGAREGINGTWVNVLALNCNAQIQGGDQGPGICVNGGTGSMINCKASNGTLSVMIENINEGTSYQDDGSVLTIVGLFVDEGFTSVGANLQIINCTNLTILGSWIFGNNSNPPMSVDGTSVVSMFGCDIGPFSYRDNTNGLSIASGGVFNCGATRIHSSGSGTALINAGTFVDLGGNTITNSSGAGTIVAGSVNTTSASATTGSNGAIPLQVAGYKLEYINGTLQKIPFYNV